MSEKPRAPSRPQPRLSVLFVDDDPLVLRMITRVLQRSPWEVLSARAPAEALGILKRRPIDVLVSDVDMPEMSGIELLRRVRSEHPETVRMLITGNATLERALSAINEGEVMRFFTKPFDADTFRAAMGQVAGRLEALRRDGRLGAQAARRQKLLGWLDGRFPGVTEFHRTDDGALVVDRVELASALEQLGAPGLAALLRDPPSETPASGPRARPPERSRDAFVPTQPVVPVRSPARDPAAPPPTRSDGEG